MMIVWTRYFVPPTTVTLALRSQKMIFSLGKAMCFQRYHMCIIDNGDAQHLRILVPAALSNQRWPGRKARGPRQKLLGPTEGTLNPLQALDSAPMRLDGSAAIDLQYIRRYVRTAASPSRPSQSQPSTSFIPFLNEAI